MAKHMIDTIVLMLTKDKFHLSDPDKFRPSARWVNNAQHALHGIQSKQNPLKKPARRSPSINTAEQCTQGERRGAKTGELCKAIYKPRLTLSSRIGPQGIATMLKIELSLPKLMFGNNFAELQYKDFMPVVKKLQMVLQQMGVVTTVDILAHAHVSAIHYSKNISLTDGSTSYQYIQKIKEANIKISLDSNETSYRNGGHSFRWHCNSYEVVFYDKIKNLEKGMQGSKRAIEKDSIVQCHLFNRFKKRKMFEVFRMEVRLNKRQKIKQLFKKLGIKVDCTFKKLFKPAISKKVLLYYLDEIGSKRTALLDHNAKSDKELLALLILHNPKCTPKSIIQMLGLARILKIVTIRELRAIFSNCNKRNWYRLISDAQKANISSPSPFRGIQEHIEKFKVLRLE